MPSPSQGAGWSHPWVPTWAGPHGLLSRSAGLEGHLADAAPRPPPARGAPLPHPGALARSHSSPSRCRLRMGRASGSVFLAQPPCARASGPLTSGRRFPGWRHHDSSMASCAESRATHSPGEVPGVQGRPRKLLSPKGGRPRPALGPLRPEANHGKRPTAGRE